MGSDEDPFFAAAAILKTVAVEPPLSDDDAEIPVKRVINGFDKKRVQLPGDNTPGKKAFTTELECLMRRVHELETELVSHPNFLLLFVFVFRFIVFSPLPSLIAYSNSGLCSSSTRDPADRENSSANTMMMMMMRMTIAPMMTTTRKIPMEATKTTTTMKTMTMLLMEFLSPAVGRYAAEPKPSARFRIMSKNRPMKSAYKRTSSPVSEKSSICKKNVLGGHSLK